VGREGVDGREGREGVRCRGGEEALGVKKRAMGEAAGLAGDSMTYAIRQRCMGISECREEACERKRISRIDSRDQASTVFPPNSLPIGRTPPSFHQLRPSLTPISPSVSPYDVSHPLHQPRLPALSPPHSLSLQDPSCLSAFHHQPIGSKLYTSMGHWRMTEEGKVGMPQAVDWEELDRG
jgi:hypothetical protein